MRLENNNWSTLGLAGFSNVASYQSLAYSSNGEPYIAYQDETNNGKATVKKYGLLLSTSDFSNNTAGIKVYPNPNSGEFTVLSSNEGHFQLMDLQGRIISQGVLDPAGSKDGVHTYSFKYLNLSKGLYLLNVTNKQRREVAKIIIE